MKARYPSTARRPATSGFGVPVRRPDEVGARGHARRSATRVRGGLGLRNLVGMLLAFNDLLTNKEANDTACEFIRDKIRAIVKDPQTAEDLCPFDHPIGTKRPCLDTGYYETFNRDNVELVDLRRTPIDEITPTGIRTSRPGVRRSTPSSSPPASTP